MCILFISSLFVFLFLFLNSSLLLLFIIQPHFISFILCFVFCFSHIRLTISSIFSPRNNTIKLMSVKNSLSARNGLRAKWRRQRTLADSRECWVAVMSVEWQQRALTGRRKRWLTSESVAVTGNGVLTDNRTAVSRDRWLKWRHRIIITGTSTGSKERNIDSRRMRFYLSINNGQATKKG